MSWPPCPESLFQVPPALSTGNRIVRNRNVTCPKTPPGHPLTVHHEINRRDWPRTKLLVQFSSSSEARSDSGTSKSSWTVLIPNAPGAMLVDVSLRGWFVSECFQLGQKTFNEFFNNRARGVYVAC
jgi:hypothetical protein